VHATTGRGHPVGRRGPAPAPTRLKLLKGTEPGRINVNEPKPLDQAATKPVYLSKRASEEWDRVAPHLEHMHTLTGADETALAVYCEAVARWRGLAEVVSNSPPVIQREGILVKNPAYSQIRDAAIEVRMYAREFGLTPSARAGIRVDHYHHDGADATRLLSS
jgi:P27 family predicted phage terminase small subunit